MTIVVPDYVTYLFIVTALLTLWFFYKASNSKLAMFALIAWTAIQGVITQTNFYLETSSLPPRFLLLVLPPLLLIIFLFTTVAGRKFIDSLDVTWLTWLHTVRAPVEITLYFLFVSKLVPELMTFEGRNLDILSGLTAPIVAFFGYHKKTFSKIILLFWNLICMALLANIVSMAVLSAPTPFQQLAYEQPNQGVFYYPFSWLPGLIVPLVLFSHLVCIRQLLKKA